VNPVKVAGSAGLSVKFLPVSAKFAAGINPRRTV
jgi:hypothetical protein